MGKSWGTHLGETGDDGVIKMGMKKIYDGDKILSDNWDMLGILWDISWWTFDV